MFTKTGKFFRERKIFQRETLLKKNWIIFRKFLAKFPKIGVNFPQNYIQKDSGRTTGKIVEAKLKSFYSLKSIRAINTTKQNVWEIEQVVSIERISK